MFSLGVAVPIVNYRFNTPTFVSATLQAGANANTLSVKLTQVYPLSSEVPLTILFKRGDVVTLTSSNSAYNGYTEQKEIERVDDDNSTIYFKEKLSYDYDLGDSVKGYGTGMPDGWILNSLGLTTISESTIKPFGGGYSSDYGFYGCVSSKEVTEGKDGWTYISMRDFDIDIWNECCWYRHGVFAKGLTFPNDTTFTLSAYDGKVVLNGSVHNTNVKPTETNTWEELTQTFKSSSDLSTYTGVQNYYNRSRTGNVGFLIYVVNHAAGASGNYAWFNISDMYLEHIRGIAPITQALENIPNDSVVYVKVENPEDFTAGNYVNIWGYTGNFENRTVVSTQGKINSLSTVTKYLELTNFTTPTSFVSGAMIEEVNNGYYTFEEYPDMGVEWAKRTNISPTTTTNNTMKYFNLSGCGERSTKIDIKMQFTNVDYTFYKKMRLFEEYCERGEMLNLHGLKTELPETNRDMLQGFMKLEGFRHTMWSRQKVDFTLQFSEA